MEAKENATKDNAVSQCVVPESPQIPQAILEVIFSLLDRKEDVLRAGGTCHTWHRASLTAPVWHEVEINPPALLKEFLEKAVTQGRGSIKFLADYRSFLLARAPVIRSLRIVKFWPADISHHDGHSFFGAILKVLGVTENLEHLEAPVPNQFHLSRRGQSDLLLQLVSNALLSSKKLKSLALEIGTLVAVDIRHLLHVEALDITGTSSQAGGVQEEAQFADILPNLPALKILQVRGICSWIRSQSLEQLSISKRPVMGIECPNLKICEVVTGPGSFCIPLTLLHIEKSVMGAVTWDHIVVKACEQSETDHKEMFAAFWRLLLFSRSSP